MADRLTDEGTRHWTGKPNTVGASIRIDGKTFRVAGRDPRGLPALDQTRVEVLPTRTIYDFAGAGIRLRLTFLTPSLPDDLDVLSRPLTYVEWDVASTDGAAHSIALYFEAAAELTVNTGDQRVAWSRYQIDGQPVLRMGSIEQPVLEERGDDLRIDWGYLYLARRQSRGRLPRGERPRPTREAFAAAAGAFRIPTISTSTARARPRCPSSPGASTSARSARQPVSRHLMLAYDDIYSIEYFEPQAAALLAAQRRRSGGPAAQRPPRVTTRSPRAAEAFDEELMADLRQAGGEVRAPLRAGLSPGARRAQAGRRRRRHRAHVFSKENFSNGCIATVDVIYPGAPLFLLFNPELLKAQLDAGASTTPHRRAGSSPSPRTTWAPTRRPTARSTAAASETEENQMPVEESGNMLILMAAAGPASTATPTSPTSYWPLLTKWAEYLKEKGLDPENQLCTDDFAGHLAHNANLSLKAILALGAYAHAVRDDRAEGRGRRTTVRPGRGLRRASG